MSPSPNKGIVAAAAIVFVLLIGVLFFSDSTSQADEIQITGAAGAYEIERKAFDYTRKSRPTIPAPPVEEKVEVQAQSYVPPPVQYTPPQGVVAPQPNKELPRDDADVQACVGKPAGSACTFESTAGEKKGTCMTLAWSPVTCVPH